MEEGMHAGYELQSVWVMGCRIRESGSVEWDQNEIDTRLHLICLRAVLYCMA